MKNRAFFQIVFVICTTLLIGSVTICQAIGQNYSDKNNGFTITLPTDWKIENKSQVVLYAASQWESDQDQFSENLVITIVEELRPLEQAQEAGIKAMRRVLSNFRFHEKGKSNINGQLSVWNTFSSTQYGVNFTDLQYLFSKKNRAYILTFKAEASKFSKYEKQFRNIAETFQFDK